MYLVLLVGCCILCHLNVSLHPICQFTICCPKEDPFEFGKFLWKFLQGEDSFKLYY